MISKFAVKMSANAVIKRCSAEAQQQPPLPLRSTNDHTFVS